MEYLILGLLMLSLYDGVRAAAIYTAESLAYML